MQRNDPGSASKHVGFWGIERERERAGVQGIRSPYLWSFSNLYTKGKYVRDHVYDPNEVSEQVGSALVLKVLEERGLWP